MSYPTYGSGSGVRPTVITTNDISGYGAPTYTTATPYGTTGSLFRGPNDTIIPGPYQYSTVNSRGTAPVTIPQRVVAEDIPVESRIEYIPFEKKYIEYDRVERIERIPFEREIVEYEEVYRTQRVPVERVITDYYAVETQIQYIPKEIQETIVEYEPVERTWERVQYLPVETQIVHYPEREKYVAGQGGKYIKGGYVTGSQVYTAPVTTTTTYQTTTPAFQTTQYQTTMPYVNSGYGYQTGGQQYVSSSRVTAPVNTQSFVSGAHGTGSNYGYTTGGGLETSAYTSGGYAQPLSGAGYVTADGTHLSSTGHILGGNSSGSQVKNNQSYQTSV